MLVRNPAAVTVKNHFPALLNHPILITGKQFPRCPVPGAQVRVRRLRDKGLFYKNIDRMHAAWSCMRPVIFHNLIPQLRQDMMEYPGAVDNVEILIQSEVTQIRTEEINIRLMDIRQPSGFSIPDSVTSKAVT